MPKIYDGMLDSEVCDKIFAFIIGKANLVESDESLPWKKGNHFPVCNYKDEEFITDIVKHQLNIVEKIKEDFGVDVYPEFSDLVVWTKGCQMHLHQDDDIGGKHPALKNRQFSSVTYLNDDYKGGETYFLSGEACKPVKGRTVIFHSDSRDMHGVTKIEEGVRLTLPIWLTTNINAMEDLLKK